MMVNNSVNVAGQGLVFSLFAFSLFIEIQDLNFNAFHIIAISLECCSLLLCRILGRAAFTGNHQWILLNNFIKDVYPREVWSFDDLLQVVREEFYSCEECLNIYLMSRFIIKV